jgi:hypothetical protein
MNIIVFIFIAWLLSGSALSADAKNTSRFEKITSLLQNGMGSRTDVFGQSALTILMEIYLAEAELARREQEELGGNVKLVNWAAAVDQYSHQLSVMLEQIGTGSPVEIRWASSALLVVAVDGRSVILSHPRDDQQTALEHRIVLDFCAQNRCERSLQRLATETPVPVSAPIFSPNWSFTVAGPVCSSHAVRIQFRAAGELANYRRLCRQLFQEISSLATEVRWQENQGVKTDWGSITIRQTPHSPEHIVALTPSGDVTLLPLPLLYSSPGLLIALVSWLKAQVADSGHSALLLDAEDYHWN